MKYFYGEYDGEEFPTQDKLFGFDQLMEFIMEYGDQAMKALEQMMNDPKNQEQSDLLEQLLKDGMLDKDGNGKLRLTPRSIGKMQQNALARHGLPKGSGKIKFTEHDLELHLHEGTTSCSTVVLLDMSGSMMRY